MLILLKYIKQVNFIDYSGDIKGRARSGAMKWMESDKKISSERIRSTGSEEGIGVGAGGEELLRMRCYVVKVFHRYFIELDKTSC